MYFSRVEHDQCNLIKHSLSNNCLLVYSCKDFAYICVRDITSVQETYMVSIID